MIDSLTVWLKEIENHPNKDEIVRLTTEQLFDDTVECVYTCSDVY